MKQLKSTSEFIRYLKANETFLRVRYHKLLDRKIVICSYDAWIFSLIDNYVDLLYLPIELNMFIPMSDDGVILLNTTEIKAYNKDGIEIPYALESTDYTVGGSTRFINAKKRLLFGGWKYGSPAELGTMNAFIYTGDISTWRDRIFFGLSGNEFSIILCDVETP